MRKTPLDEIGNIYNRLTVSSFFGRTSNGTYIYNCVCICGNSTTVNINSLRTGQTKSCGCLKKELIDSKPFKTHGLTKTPEYKSWTGIKERCYNKNNSRYADWGGRGIKMCQRWFDSFENFLEDMGKKPTRLHSIERVDYDGDYCPENCKWATPAEQNSNKRNNLRFEYNGKLLTIKDLAKINGIKDRILYQRLHIYKMPLEKAILKNTKQWKN